MEQGGSNTNGQPSDWDNQIRLLAQRRKREEHQKWQQQQEQQSSNVENGTEVTPEDKRHHDEGRHSQLDMEGLRKREEAVHKKEQELSRWQEDLKRQQSQHDENQRLSRSDGLGISIQPELDGKKADTPQKPYLQAQSLRSGGRSGRWSSRQFEAPSFTHRETTPRSPVPGPIPEYMGEGGINPTSPRRQGFTGGGRSYHTGNAGCGCLII